MSITQHSYTWYHHLVEVAHDITDDWNLTESHSLKNGVKPLITAFPLGDGRDDDEDVRAMITRHDDDFHPRLSERFGFSGSFGDGGRGQTGISGYMDSLRHHGMVCIRMTVDTRLISLALLNIHDDGMGLYVPLMLTDKDYRGIGAMSFMYDIIERIADTMKCTVRLRTSSSYASQNHLLEHRHWRTTAVREHDRGDGIHTTYHEYGKGTLEQENI